MAASTSLSFFSSILFLLLSTTIAATSFRPKALLFPVTKDPSLQHIIQLRQRTPLVPVKLTVDLGGQFMWVDCNRAYISSTYKPARCRSAQCSLASKSTSCGQCFSPPRPGCNNNTCGLFPGNTIIHLSTSGEVASDVVSVSSTNGFNPTTPVSVPKFLFVCGTTFLLDGLAGGVTGMAGFGRTGISLPSQFAAAFSFNRKFAICLSSSTRLPGVIFSGNGPYNFLPNIDLTKSLTYTPLFINPVSTAGVFSAGEKSAEYFIGVKSIVINSKTVPLNTTLLKINSKGIGGTKISTVNPYTVMESSIYKAVLKTFTTELRKIPRVPAVAPFEACFNANSFGSTRLGPGMPSIDLILQNKNVIWRIFGANSMVQVNEKVLCLGFVDGGVEPRTSIVIGAHQIEDALLEFDLATSRLGFISTLLGRMTTCSNFNFTAKP
ncbi:basic 7S globulin-like [Cucurbita pepo subsp. pepo]|uniref:basic 7S globulin-like n=1 Tax=Cucurbita pepo subsp. pepo TaxID=3664 RepID=UPI000C9D8402|nr:basic 7S globulin-like [Cucurbita pepo subsp. pepo]